MKKALFMLLAVLLIGGTAFAGVPFPDTTTRDIMIENPTGGLRSKPVTIIKKVRFGRIGPDVPKLNSGDVVSWDGLSADGVTVSACLATNQPGYAGVLVTDILTSDNASYDDSTNWGYMAIRGYCLAKVDTSAATSMERLMMGGGGLIGAFATVPTTVSGSSMSDDIGILLSDSGSDGLMPVLLK